VGTQNLAIIPRLSLSYRQDVVCHKTGPRPRNEKQPEGAR